MLTAQVQWPLEFDTIIIKTVIDLCHVISDQSQKQYTQHASNAFKLVMYSGLPDHLDHLASFPGLAHSSLAVRNLHRGSDPFHRVMCTAATYTTTFY